MVENINIKNAVGGLDATTRMYLIDDIRRKLESKYTGEKVKQVYKIMLEELEEIENAEFEFEKEQRIRADMET